MEFNLKKAQHKTVTGRMDSKKITQIEILDLEDDNKIVFTPKLQKGTTKKTAISVEQYNEDRDLQLAIMASLGHPENFINLEDDNDDDNMHVLNFVPKNTPMGKRKKPFSIHSITENGQSSNSKHKDPSFVCEICVEPKLPNESFSIKGCSHMYCTDCMIKYVASKLQESITSIRCPTADCRGVLEPQYCRNILPQEVFDRWGNALCEAVILGAQKFYCPFKDCSALLIKDDDGGGEVAIRESECPYCNRLFCAQCKVAWHAGIGCEEFQKLNKNEREPEDIMLMNLAKNKRWRRCQICKYYIEKRGGCGHVRCRCGFEFHDYN